MLLMNSPYCGLLVSLINSYLPFNVFIFPFSIFLKVLLQLGACQVFFLYQGNWVELSLVCNSLCKEPGT